MCGKVSHDVDPSRPSQSEAPGGVLRAPQMPPAAALWDGLDYFPSVVGLVDTFVALDGFVLDVLPVGAFTSGFGGAGSDVFGGCTLVRFFAPAAYR